MKVTLISNEQPTSGYHTSAKEASCTTCSTGAPCKECSTKAAVQAMISPEPVQKSETVMRRMVEDAARATDETVYKAQQSLEAMAYNASDPQNQLFLIPDTNLIAVRSRNRSAVHISVPSELIKRGCTYKAVIPGGGTLEGKFEEGTLDIDTGGERIVLTIMCDGTTLRHTLI